MVIPVADILEPISDTSFFFFQAEDGIRDRTVTGVQTCALPICFRYRRHGVNIPKNGSPPHAVDSGNQAVNSVKVPPSASEALLRSEERRVGKECRCRRCGGQ